MVTSKDRKIQGYFVVNALIKLSIISSKNLLFLEIKENLRSKKYSRQEGLDWKTIRKIIKAINEFKSYFYIKNFINKSERDVKIKNIYKINSIRIN